MNFSTVLCLVALVPLCGWSQVESQRQEEIDLPPLFGDNMVLQKGQINLFWGTAPPGANVWIKYKTGKPSEVSDQATVRRDGSWRLELDLTKPVEPYPDYVFFGLGKANQPSPSSNRLPYSTSIFNF